MLEYHEAYADYQKIARDFEEMIKGLTQATLGSSEIEMAGRRIDLSHPWQRISFSDAISQEVGIDLLGPDSREKMSAFLGREDLSWAEMADKIFSSQVEPKLQDPTFVFDYPLEMSPFAKRHPTNPRLVERFEAFLGGREIANAFSELNDPREQKARFLAQEKSAEAQPFDASFLRALEHGMPPTGGLGLGLDRLVMILSGRENLREVILFPSMRQ